MILVIDDNAASTDAIARTLRETGREVHIASTVPDALAALAADTPLCVVLDLVLGSDATALHTALTRRRLPVLLVCLIIAAASCVAAGWVP
jgi:DNA-binding NtrC family response regulator